MPDAKTQQGGERADALSFLLPLGNIVLHHQPSYSFRASLRHFVALMLPPHLFVLGSAAGDCGCRAASRQSDDPSSRFFLLVRGVAAPTCMAVCRLELTRQRADSALGIPRPVLGNLSRDCHRWPACDACWSSRFIPWRCTQMPGGTWTQRPALSTTPVPRGLGPRSFM